jgi:hypothetical protein
MPRCPSCGKVGFANHEAVARHMSQPRSGCSTWSDNLIRLHEELLPARSHPIQEDSMAVDEDTGSVQDFHDEGVSEHVSAHGPFLATPTSTVQFPDAAHSFEGGKTFLDKFDADQFGKYRVSNVYYPYSSRGEWELASWLLRSSLSMSVIDSFLSLNLVCVAS